MYSRCNCRFSILEKIKSNKDLIKEYDQFIEEWKLDKKYHKGIIIKSKDVYFKCNKTYMKGDMVKFYGVIYISEIDYNDSEPSEKNNKWRII